MCPAGTIVNYTAGTLTMTNATTNYVYLDLAASCAPASNTTGFTSSGIPIATVVTSGGAITTLTDVRTAFFAGSGATGSGAGAPGATGQNRRICTLLVGADNAASVLVDADIGPQRNQCRIPFAATAIEVVVNADAGVPSVIVQKRHCSTYAAGVCTAWTDTDLLSSALAAHTGGFDACSNTGGTTGLDGGTTCSATLQNTAIAAGDWLQLKSGTAGGTAKRLTTVIK